MRISDWSSDVCSSDLHAHPNHVAKSLLVGIVRPRLEETFELVRSRLEASGYAGVDGRRVVLTGGASQLPGVRALAQLVLDTQISMGRPRRVRGRARSAERRVGEQGVSTWRSRGE